MSGVFGTAIEPAGSGIEVSHNRLQQGFNGMLFILPNVNHAVHDNDIQGMGQFGLIAFANALDNSVIAGNRLSDNVVDGLNLQARNSGNRIEKNRADGNGRDGASFRRWGEVRIGPQFVMSRRWVGELPDTSAEPDSSTESGDAVG